MKKHWGAKIFCCLFPGILILQLFPYVFMGKWGFFLFILVSSPFFFLLREPMIRALCAAIASTCTWALVIMSMLSMLKLIWKGFCRLYGAAAGTNIHSSGNVVHKKIWSIKTFGLVLVGTLLVQSLPFLLIWQWDSTFFYYAVFPFSLLFEREIPQIICAAIASS